MQKAATGMGVFSHSQIHKMTQSTFTPGNNRETQGRKKIELTHTHRGMRERCCRHLHTKGNQNSLWLWKCGFFTKFQSKSPALVQSTSNNCGICYSKGLDQLSKGIFTAVDHLSWRESADDFAQAFPRDLASFHAEKSRWTKMCRTEPCENVQSAYRAIWARIHKSSNCSY